MTYQPQETELPLLHYGRHQDQQESRGLASSSHSLAQTASIVANKTMDDPRLTCWPRPIDRDQQEQSVRDGYTTDTSCSTQNGAVLPSTRPNFASENSRSKLLRPKEIPVHMEQKRDEKWQPFWLRPAVLGTFSTFFICCAVALPVLLALSQKNDGLLEARKDLEPLWRFGPTAVLTFVTILWGRVELQTLRYFPWTQSQHSTDYYTLDYTSKISPVILFQSLRNKHLMVFIITLTTLMLKVQVVLMPSLFFLKPVWVSRPVNVQTWDSFDPNYVHRTTNNTIATLPYGYYNARAIQEFDTGIPFGVGNKSIYQTFAQANTGKDARGSTDSPLTALVDGLFLDIECRKMESCISVMSENGTVLQVNLEFDGCPESTQLNFELYRSKGEEWGNRRYWGVITNAPANCSTLPGQFEQIVYLAAQWKPSPENASLLIQDACAAILCSPTAWMSKVEVRDDGNYPSMTILPDQPKTPIKTDTNKLIRSTVPWALGGDIGYDNGTRAPVVTNDTIKEEFRIDTFMLDSVDLAEKYRHEDIPHSLYDNDILHKSMLNVTQKLGGLAMHHELRVKKEGQTVGSRLFETARLQLNQSVCICLAVFSAILSFISLWAMFKYKGEFRNWDKNPATILGSMGFFYGQTLDSLSVERETRSKLWSQRHDPPLPLPTWLRLVTTLYILALIISLIMILHMSNISNGVVTLGEGTLSLWWTAAPALAFFLVTLYTTSSDTTIRDLAMYSTLSVRSCTAKELDVSLLDMLGFRALYYSLRWKIYSVTLSQLLAIACGFLAPFSALLFTSETNPGYSNVSIKQQSWFGSRPQTQELEVGQMSKEKLARYAVGGLVATEQNSNFTWPQFTYRDLLFPRLEVDGPTHDWNSSVTFELEVPATALMPECTQLFGDFLSFKPGYKVTWQNELRGEFVHTCPNGSTVNIEIGVNGSTNYANNTYMLGEFPIIPDPCPTDLWLTKLFIWGKTTHEPNFDFTSVWRCNYTWVQIPTKMHMRWTAKGLQVDHQNPPSPDVSKAKPLYPHFPVPKFPFNDTDVWPDVSQDPAFQKRAVIAARMRHLFDHGGTLNETYLGDPTKEETILEKINFSYTLAAAHLANAMNRLDVDEASTANPEHPGELPLITATVIDRRRLRLIQNPQMTYFILSILSLGFIINAWALASAGLSRFISYRGKWLLDLEMKDLVPPAFNSMAMTDALLSLSNYHKYIGSPGDISTGLAGLRFRMGWFTKKGSQERELTIGVLDDPGFIFLGGKQSNP